MTLIDSSVWIETLHNPTFRNFSRVSEIMDAGATTCGPVIQEVLQGIREEAVLQEVRRRMFLLPYLEATRETFDAASRLFRKCKRLGVRARTVDVLIAAVAIENGATLWTLGEDFARIQRHSDLQLYK